MKLRLPIVAVVLAGLLAMTAGSALAIISGTPDAAQLTHDHSLVPQSTLAQTFVPTISGSLGTVEVYTSIETPPKVVTEPAAATDITVEIRSTASNLPTNNVLATQTLPPADSDWDVVSFTLPTNVVAGTQYALVVINGASSFAQWVGACGDPYTPGVGYIHDTTWKTIPVFDAGSCITDSAFQTFITAPAKSAPPTSTISSNTGDTRSDPSYLLIFAGLALAASAAVVVSISRRRVTQQ